MKYKEYAIVEGKAKVVFETDSEEEFKAYRSQLPEEDPEYLTDELEQFYSPSAPWNAPGMKVSDFI